MDARDEAERLLCGMDLWVFDEWTDERGTPMGVSRPNPNLVRLVAAVIAEHEAWQDYFAAGCDDYDQLKSASDALSDAHQEVWVAVRAVREES